MNWTQPPEPLRDDQLILGVETSCDETSAAVLRGNGELLGHVILSQDVHEVYGGVVPELAARHHLQRIDSVVGATLKQAGVGYQDLDAVAATAGPGLIGALLVGFTWSKTVAFALGKPLVPVHHMEAHLFGPAIKDPEAEPPFIGLLVSGGHSLILHAPAWGDYTLLGQTRDDAAGEAFDKVAKMMGLPYPGGPILAKLADQGDETRFSFPRPMLSRSQKHEDSDYWDMSFSGLKTSVLNTVRNLEAEGPLEPHRADLAAGFQAAAVDVLVSKTMRAVDAFDCPRVLIGGGVSANVKLRQELAARLGSEGRLFRASPRLSLDNGAMIARAGLFRLSRGDVAQLDDTATPNLPFPGMKPLNATPGKA